MKHSLIRKISSARYPVAIIGLDYDVQRKKVQETLTKEFFDKNPLGFYEFLKIEELNKKNEPKLVHKSLASLNVKVITLQIDGLFHLSGCETIELHGNLEYLKCPKCKVYFPTKTVLSNEDYNCDNCKEILRPNIVLIGENVSQFPKAINMTLKADLIILIGNSKDIWPANNLLKKVYNRNCEILETDENLN